MPIEGNSSFRIFDKQILAVPSPCTWIQQLKQHSLKRGNIRLGIDSANSSPKSLQIFQRIYTNHEINIPTPPTKYGTRIVIDPSFAPEMRKIAYSSPAVWSLPTSNAAALDVSALSVAPCFQPKVPLTVLCLTPSIKQLSGFVSVNQTRVNMPDCLHICEK
jgi:hypothetical protein